MNKSPSFIKTWLMLHKSKIEEISAALVAFAIVVIIFAFVGAVGWLASYYNNELPKSKMLELIGQTEHPECVARYVASKEFPDNSGNFFSSGPRYFSRKHISAGEDVCEREAKVKSLEELQKLKQKAGDAETGGDQ